MARSLRSNVAQANKKKLRENTFHPYEAARLERLSAKQKKIADQPKSEDESKDAGPDDVDMAEDDLVVEQVEQEEGPEEDPEEGITLEATPNNEAVPAIADTATNATDTNGMYTPANISSVLSGGLVFPTEFQQPGPFTEAEEVFASILASRLVLGGDIAGFREDGRLQFDDFADANVANFFASEF